MPDRTLVRWSALLDELEREAARAGDPRDAPRWQPPTGLGPLPEELRPRAEALAEAQAAAIDAVTEARNSAARHLAALRDVPQGRDDTRPIYLDMHG